MSTTFNANGHGRTSVSNELVRIPTGVVHATLGQRCLGCAFSGILRVLSASWRVEIRGLNVLEQLSESDRPPLFAFWHQHYIALFKLMKDRRVVVITNQSPRGHIIADICRRNGMHTMQTGESGRKALLDAIQHFTSNGYGLGIAVDGPLGPAERVKRVVPHLAAKLDLPVVPVAVNCSNRYEFTNRWDGLQIPYPFSRVTIAIGEALHFANKPDVGSSSEQAAQLQDRIHNLTRAIRGDTG